MPPPRLAFASLLWLSQSFLNWIITINFPTKSDCSELRWPQLHGLDVENDIFFCLGETRLEFPKQIVIRETEQKQIIKGHRSLLCFLFCYILLFLFSFSFKLFNPSYIFPSPEINTCDSLSWLFWYLFLVGDTWSCTFQSEGLSVRFPLWKMMTWFFFPLTPHLTTASLFSYPCNT